MVYRHTKLAKELVKQKENETTWLKINNIFEDMLKDFSSVKAIEEEFVNFNEILLRSVQSERSRLNGTALELLKKISETMEERMPLNTYIPVLIKLCGRANKIFISRAQSALLVVGKYVDGRCLIKNINENIDNINKNVRFTIYQLIILRASLLGTLFAGYIEKGYKDPGQEVRTLCKEIGTLPAAALKDAIPKTIKKQQASLPTPRKNIKLDDQHGEKIKVLEKEITKIASGVLNKEASGISFREKLLLLKKERALRPEPTRDELTPGRLDRYLDKYRNRSDQMLSAPRSSMEDIRKIIDNYKRSTLVPAVECQKQDQNDSSAKSYTLKIEEVRLVGEAGGFNGQKLPSPVRIPNQGSDDAYNAPDGFNASLSTEGIKACVGGISPQDCPDYELKVDTLTEGNGIKTAAGNYKDVSASDRTGEFTRKSAPEGRATQECLYGSITIQDEKKDILISKDALDMQLERGQLKTITNGIHLEDFNSPDLPSSTEASPEGLPINKRESSGSCIKEANSETSVKRNENASLPYLSFVRETFLFKSEMKSSNSRNGSLIHEQVPASIVNEQTYSEPWDHEESVGELHVKCDDPSVLKDTLDCSETATVAEECISECSLANSEVNGAGASAVDCISECSLIFEDAYGNDTLCMDGPFQLSKSLANISLEPMTAADASEKLLTENKPNLVGPVLQNYKNEQKLVIQGDVEMGNKQCHAQDKAATTMECPTVGTQSNKDILSCDRTGISSKQNATESSEESSGIGVEEGLECDNPVLHEAYNKVPAGEHIRDVSSPELSDIHDLLINKDRLRNADFSINAECIEDNVDSAIGIQASGTRNAYPMDLSLLETDIFKENAGEMDETFLQIAGHRNPDYTVILNGPEEREPILDPAGNVDEDAGLADYYNSSTAIFGSFDREEDLLGQKTLKSVGAAALCPQAVSKSMQNNEKRFGGTMDLSPEEIDVPSAPTSVPTEMASYACLEPHKIFNETLFSNNDVSDVDSTSTFQRPIFKIVDAHLEIESCMSSSKQENPQIQSPVCDDTVISFENADIFFPARDNPLEDENDRVQPSACDDTVLSFENDI